MVSRLYNKTQRALLARAIEDYHNKTCIRFEPRRWYEFTFIYILPGPSCASQVGRIGFGPQLVHLDQYGCMTFGVIQHELMHVIGFWHEHSRYDRDDYIRIIWENIEPGMESNFQKFTPRQIQHLDEDYDYSSLMHYDLHAFARSYGATLSPLKETNGTKIGQRNGLSVVDVRKINKLYNCTSYL